MPVITFEGKRYECAPEETILEGLERQGVLLPSSCRAGSCQTCMMRAVSGEPTPESQQGIKDTLRVQGYFLACMCKPREDMEISLAATSEKRKAEVIEKRWMNEQVIRLRLKSEGFDYIPGQFINLVRAEDGLTRSYSLASLPDDEDFLELHVRHIPGGKVSGWVHSTLKKGDRVTISPATGDCFYTPGQPTQNLLLIGTGTGLAPLYGILRDALRQGHQGDIHLYHGSSTVEGLYLVDELKALDAAHANVHYHPCVSQGTPPAGIASGRADQKALEEIGKLGGWRIYLCGREDMVKSARQKAFLSGASLKDIYADPFVPAVD